MLHDPKFQKALVWVVLPAAGLIGNSLIVWAQLSSATTAIASFGLGCVVTCAIMFVTEDWA